MHPFHPNAGQPHRPRPGDPGPHAPHPAAFPPAAFPPPPVPNLAAAAANPMAAAAAANPFLAMQLFGQAQQLQNLGFLAAAAFQQQQQQPQAPFFPGGGGFPPPNPNQFGGFHGQHAGFNGGGAFRPGGVGVAGPRPPPRPMMGAASGNNYNSGGGGRGMGAGYNSSGSSGGHGMGAGAPRPVLNGGGNDRNSGGGGKGGEVNHTKIKPDGISHFASENGERKNTTDQKTRFNPGRDCRDGRQFGPSGGRGRGRSFNQGRGRGNNNWRDAKSNFRSSDSPSPASGQRHNDNPASGGNRKRPPIIYDAKEVKQWLEARKKNYPTSANINKKLSVSQPDGEKKDEDAQTRRQELKEVLAKQKELGFELPELPPGYLSEHEDQGNGRRSNWKTQRRDCRFGNRADNKRSRYDRKDFQSKRPKVQNRTCDDGAMVKSREPTLLQKLLSSDIKRDRHRLLHTFKFMVLNNFFSDYPDKPLEFPSVKVNQIELESNVTEEDLDDLLNNEMTKESNFDLKENGDQKDSSSVDGESILDDNNGGDDDGEEDDDYGNASAESSDKDE
uniref:FMR1-interacting protein 1 conserved domain-containing protein n=1 Tax=Leersia perrieri TaxID=77586 RepID=A0A0D9V721_9ORYZ